MATGWRFILVTSMDYKLIKFRWYSSLALGVPTDAVMGSVFRVEVATVGRGDGGLRSQTSGLKTNKTVTQETLVFGPS